VVNLANILYDFSSYNVQRSLPNTCEACACTINQKTTYQWQTQNWNTVEGDTHQLSDILCPPGTIQKSYTKSWSYTVSVTSGPDFVSSNNVMPFYIWKINRKTGDSCRSS
jgi:hypothetical protein